MGADNRLTRRELLVQASLMPFARHIPLSIGARAKPLRFAVITDLHHGLAPDALTRLQAFVDEVKERKRLDAVLQLGDFCYSQPDSRECVQLFETLRPPKIHVLGNHDMDKCDKETAMKFWGMDSRYGSHIIGGYRFVVLDLNHFKKDGALHSYANGNYFTDNASHNWADPEQLEWLENELKASKEPVILLSHQPLGFAEKGQPLPPEQSEVLDIVFKTLDKNPAGVLFSLFGHLHVDRYESPNGLPCLCVNSASYFWYEGMRPYTKPLFAFMEITTTGMLKVEGVAGQFQSPPPEGSDKVVGRSASIGDRSIRIVP